MTDTEESTPRFPKMFLLILTKTRHIVVLGRGSELTLHATILMVLNGFTPGWGQCVAGSLNKE